MGSLLIKNCKRYDTSETGHLCSVLADDGVIRQIGTFDPQILPDRVLDAEGRILAPGFIDVHIQGAGGADVLDATPDALEAISTTCARSGVTGFLATTVFKPGQENRHLQVAATCVGGDLRGARLLGIHLESPFISAKKRGMIQPDCISAPSAPILEEIYGLVGDHLKMMVVAPELPGNAEIIEALVDRGTVACLGHTAASYEEARRGFDAGISHVTHLFNAMPGMHHREPGPLGAIFETDAVTCQVITDGVHIHPSVVRLAYAMLGTHRFVTITDGIQALGLPDGKYVYNNVEYEARDGAARYADGTLIGTALGLNRMLARLMDFTGCSLSEAVNTVTRNAAGVLGLPARKGAIEVGKDADLVLLDHAMSVWATVVNGRVVYQAARERDAQ